MAAAPARPLQSAPAPAVSGAEKPMLTWAVRPSRWEFTRARAALALTSGAAPLLLGATAFLLGASAGVQLLPVLRVLPWWRGPLAALEVLLWLAAPPAALLFAAAGLLLLLWARARDPLERAELEGGALIALGDDGVTVTVQGATSHFGWEHVEVRAHENGFVFRLPRGAVHLLPYAAVGGAREVWAMGEMLRTRRPPSIRLWPRSRGWLEARSLKS